MATSLKSDTCDVLVSSITVRNDQHHKKVAEVNIVLKGLCKEKNLHYINHEKKIKAKQVNGSKLHLKRKGTSILWNTFVESISNASQWRSILHSFYENRSGSYMNNEYKANSLSESNNAASLCSIRKR